jgi:hypothetical protein
MGIGNASHLFMGSFVALKQHKTSTQTLSNTLLLLYHCFFASFILYWRAVQKYVGVVCVCGYATNTDHTNAQGVPPLNRCLLFCVLLAHGEKRTQPRATALQ